MEIVTVKRYNLRQLKRKFENRDFAIPEIQRQYVWNRPQVLKLMDSILKNYPIGIGLVWYAPFSKAIHIRPNNKTILPPFNRKAKHAELVIDGQQRLSTLYGVFMGIEDRPDAGSPINFRNIFFNCDKTADKRFLFSKIYDENTRGYVRLFDLISLAPSVLRKRLHLTNSAFSEVQKCQKAFHDYSFFLLMYNGNDLDDIREVFIRINSAGMRVNRADTLFAKATDVNLRDNILDARRGLKNGYELISVDAMLNTLALAYGALRITGREINSVLAQLQKEKKEDKTFGKSWKRLEYGFGMAVDFLVQHLKVTSPDLLPSQNIFTLLAFFFYERGSRAGSNEILEIKRWFWHTACGERYSGAAFNKNVPADILFFRRLARKRAKYGVSERLSVSDFLKADYSKSSSIANAYYILLRNKKPLYLANGEELLLDFTSSRANRKDRHHIYPSALLKRREVNPKWINSICNICYLEADENQSISDTIPSKYFLEYKKLRHFNRVLKSHLIPYSSSSPIWDNHIKLGFLRFLNERGAMIINEIERLAGSKIFEKFDGIKRL